MFGKVCHQILKVYVIPRLLYGLEVLHLTSKQLDTLTKFHLKLLKQIQGLPQQTANAGYTYCWVPFQLKDRYTSAS